MSIAELGSLGELIGSLAVVVTLLFLTFQMRQNTSALESNSESDAALEWAALHARIGADPTLVELFEKAVTREHELTPEEVGRLRWLIGEFVFICEAQYRRRLRGLLTEETWQRQLDNLIGMIDAFDCIKEFWERYPVAPSFQRYIKNEMASDRPDTLVLVSAGSRG